MKKLFAALLCSIPLVANAVNIGGFEFPEEGILPIGDAVIITYKDSDGTSWYGAHFEKQNKFMLYSKARGSNKVWAMLSYDKGHALPLDKNIKSSVLLMELDCAEGRSRTLKLKAFTGYFLAGKSALADDNRIREWEYGDPGDINILIGCEVLKAYKK